MSATVCAASPATPPVQWTAEVLANDRLARDTFRLRVTGGEIARRILPGQFVMIRLAGLNDPLLGRPLALWNVVPHASGLALEVVYLVKGKFTTRLAQWRPGQAVEVWGPLGNGFAPAGSLPLAAVAGGIGVTPFLALAREALGKQSYGVPPRAAARQPGFTLCYGARTADLLAGEEEFRAAGVELRLATDDGSRGFRGTAADLLRQVLAERGSEVRIVCCGPEPLMEAVGEIAAHAGAACEVSLETPMACGVGICFTCVAKVRDEQGGWDYRRTCVEGPVFDAARIVW